MKTQRIHTATLTAIIIAVLSLTPAAYAQTDITDKFPDPNFLSKVRAALEIGEDDPVYKEDVEEIKMLDVSNSNIASLVGIEYFTVLTMLYVNNNNLTEIDVSNNTKLLILQVHSNQLTEIDVSKNTALTGLQVPNNQLTEIDVSNNTKLVALYVNNNNLSEIDVSNNTALTSLQVQNNQLTSLDVSKNTALTNMLIVSNNQLIALDVSKNTALKDLRVSNNKLTSIDLSKNTTLTTLYIDNNRLTSLDVGNNILIYFGCSYNYLSEVIGWDGDIGFQYDGEPQYVVIVINDGHGTATADLTDADMGDEITLTATANTGYQFKEWQVVSGNVTIANNKFTMPARDVAIKAVFEAKGTPIRTPQIASNQINVHAKGNSIVLQNLPQNAKVEVYGLNGKLISGKSLNPVNRGSDMSISVQTKGMYIVKVSSSNEIKMVKAAVR